VYTHIAKPPDKMLKEQLRLNLPAKFVDPTKFVGRISLSAEISCMQFIIGRYGYLPY
jgi:hypothetical protein